MFASEEKIPYIKSSILWKRLSLFKKSCLEIQTQDFVDVDLQSIIQISDSPK